jgi:TonB family protein
MSMQYLKMSAVRLILAVAGTSALLADIRVPMSEALKQATSKPSPEYSGIARQMKVSGHVEVEATVGTDGSVESVKATVGNPLLTSAAVAAVKRWKFTPFTADGAATKAIATISFDFK